MKRYREYISRLHRQRDKPIAAVLSTACLAGMLILSACSAQQSDQDFAREAIVLADGWRFYFGEASNDVLQPEYDDSSWDDVDVPHSWNRVGYYTDDAKEHIHGPDNVDMRMGIGWYRHVFTVPGGSEGKRAWLEFDAASRTAEVWLNGIRLGDHRGPFTRFRFDATDAIDYDRSNLLVVKTDNSKPSPESSTADVLPISGDFFVHGGLYRPVRLIFIDPIHVGLHDFGGPGVYATTTQLGESAAEVSVRAILRNSSRDDVEVEWRASLIDNAGAVVANSGAPVALAAGETADVTRVLEVADPVLWDGVQNPHLYVLRVELWSSDSRLLDRLDQQYGLRRFEIDPEKGFVLNGTPYRLRGVSYHQDREGKGYAVSVADIEEDVNFILELGANTIRLAHYPHGQPVHELANRHGLVVWDEIPLVTSWTYGSEHAKANEALAANARLQLTEMIRQNFNHPSVAVWGIANEVDFGAVVPAFLGVPTGGVIPSPMPLLKDLAAQAKLEDATRPSTLANCCEGRAGLEDIDIPPAASASETVGANRYFGWYYGGPEELGPHLDALRRLRPEQPLSVSEYGAGGAASIHTDNPRGGPVDATGRRQPEEYMSFVHETNWESISSRDYLWGSWIWNGFDFATTVRREGDAIDINTKGLITYGRLIKKDPFYFYKANWATDKTVHITGRRYHDRAYPTTDVRIYSNADDTELRINGQSQGNKTTCPQNVCVWPDVRLSAGTNLISAHGAFPSGEHVDSVEWELDPGLEHAYHIDAGALVAATSDVVRYGSDNFFKGGTAGTVDKPGGWGRPAEVTSIFGTTNRELMATYREGSFSYRLPLENGDYSITLSFVEPTEPPVARRFDVLANGSTLLEEVDVSAMAGGALREVSRTFEVTVDDNVLELSFESADQQRAIISAISVVPIPL